MGHRLEIYTDPESAQGMMAIAQELGIESRIAGRVESGVGKTLTIVTEHGKFEYSHH
jgi:phosphoribosylformylglycinamidine cyclo-ligase